MKKVCLSLLTLVLCTTLFSQINKGQWLAGGSIGFESGKFGDFDASKFTSFEFSPDAGYFFMQNLAAGARVSFQTMKFKEQDATNSFLFSPFVRYYFLPATRRVNILADGSYGLGSMKNEEGSETFNQFAIAAGPAVFLSPNTALEFTLRYSSAGGDAYGGDDRLKNFGLNVGFQVHLGK